MKNWKGAEPHFLTYGVYEHSLCCVVNLDDVMLDSLGVQFLSKKIVPQAIHVANICIADHIFLTTLLGTFNCVEPLQCSLETIPLLGQNNQTL